MARTRQVFLWIGRVLLALLLLLLGYLGLHYDDLKYGWSLYQSQQALIKQARPKDAVMADTAVHETVKNKIRLVEQIQQFATDSLHLEGAKNYQLVYDKSTDPVLWRVTACPDFALEPYTWEFPIMGETSYKGFFEKEKAETLKQSLEEQGYQAQVTPVQAWSSLGFLEEPLMGNLLYKPDGSLAQTIIHEMAHSTMWVKGNTELNENLATYIGDQGAKAFMAHHYGKGSKQHKNYVNRLSDYQKYSQHMVSGARQLDSLYQSFAADLSVEQKTKQKHALIDSIVQGLYQVDFYFPEKYLNYFREKPKPDNTYFLSYLRYRGRQKAFRKTLAEKYNGRLAKHVLDLKEQYPQFGL